MIHTRWLTEADWEPLAGVLAESFNFANVPGWDVFRARVGDNNVRVALDGETVVGGLGSYPLGTYLGGRRLPMGGLAAVGVAPEWRGRGVARRLVLDTLRELRARGVPLAGLYPASLPVYRSYGFEQAGERVQYEVPLDAIVGFRPEVAVTRQALDDDAEIRRRYRPRAGNLDRGAAIWGRLLQPVGGGRQAYLLGDDGYVILVQVPPDGHHYDIEVYDYAAPSPATLRTLLAFLAGFRSLGEKLRWFGEPCDPLLGLIPEVRWSVKQHQRWMLRVLDPAAALAARGYTVEGELHIELHDAHFPENSGRYVLHAGDSPRVEVGGRGELRTGERGLAPLLSGLYSASTLAQMGLVEGTREALATADRIFAGAVPFLREMY